MARKKIDPLYARIRDILESARSNVARSVNSTQVIANWLVGREIVEEEQRGSDRAGYDERLLATLSESLRKDYDAGFSVSSLQYMRGFYQLYPMLLTKQHAARVKLLPQGFRGKQIQHAARVELPMAKSKRIRQAMDDEGAAGEDFAPAPKESWKPGLFHSSLSWTHYRTLLRVEKSESRAFYEIESIQNNWSARELERQINSLLYERLALSKDKKGLLKLAKKGQEIQAPLDIFKDPTIIEFLGLPESPKLAETNLEQTLIDNLQAFLLEMGKGFAFVARQQRITIDGDHFYIDLVFYHILLKCFVLLDLKVGKLTHQDLGQLQLYVNYYDQHFRTDGDQPALGLILCTDKNDSVVRYTLGNGYQKKVFASRYQLHVPSESRLEAKLRRELRRLGLGPSKGA